MTAKRTNPADPNLPELESATLEPTDSQMELNTGAPQDCKEFRNSGPVAVADPQSQFESGA